MAELGRFMTGPYGCLIAQAMHEKKIYKNYVGLDACAVDLMRPAMYGAYHHITVLGKENAPADHLYDVTGGLCENNDKFAVDRLLPKVEMGDYLCIHDTSAHGYSMGYNYNGKLRSAELLLKEDSSVQLLRRAETPKDYFSTLVSCIYSSSILQSKARETARAFSLSKIGRAMMPNSVYRAVFPYPPEAVYHAVADLHCWQWRSDLAALELGADGGSFTETAKNGSRTHFIITEKQIAAATPCKWRAKHLPANGWASFSPFPAARAWSLQKKSA